MIPYFQIVSFEIGPLTVYVWGLAVALGFLLATAIARARIERRGLSGEAVTSLAVWIIIGSVIGARLVHAAAYQPEIYLADPWEIFRVWNGGLSSTGGFLGGTAAAFLFFRRRLLPLPSYADAVITAFPWGWAVGRLGCFLTHLHPGLRSDFFLAVRFPDGPRLDMGLIEILNALGMAIVIALTRRWFRRDGQAVMIGIAWYSIVRFLTDFLRADDLPMSDIRYSGLTPAQYAMVLLFVVAVIIFLRSRKRPAVSYVP